MVIGIGCDIVEHNTTINLNWDSDISIQKRIFTSKEIEIYWQKKDITFLTGRFAAKEAVLKCLGTGMRDGIALTDIQILQLDSGKPIIELSGLVRKRSVELGINAWQLTISHSNNHSIAFVLAQKIK